MLPLGTVKTSSTPPAQSASTMRGSTLSMCSRRGWRLLVRWFALSALRAALRHLLHAARDERGEALRRRERAEERHVVRFLHEQEALQIEDDVVSQRAAQAEARAAAANEGACQPQSAKKRAAWGLGIRASNCSGADSDFASGNPQRDTLQQRTRSYLQHCRTFSNSDSMQRRKSSCTPSTGNARVASPATGGLLMESVCKQAGGRGHGASVGRTTRNAGSRQHAATMHGGRAGGGGGGGGGKGHESNSTTVGCKQSASASSLAHHEHCVGTHRPLQPRPQLAHCGLYVGEGGR